MSNSVDFFYDFGSPTTYLAWTQLPRICAARGASINWKPFLLGGVFKAIGNASPVMIPAKAKFMFRDLERWARHWDVPFTLNPYFPFNTLELMRAAAGVQLHDPSRFDGFNRAIFTSMWVRALDFNKPEVVADTLTQAGFDPAAVKTMAGDERTKAALRANTDEAVARGAFGAPTFFVGDEMYWGQDRLFMVEQALAS